MRHARARESSRDNRLLKEKSVKEKKTLKLIGLEPRPEVDRDFIDWYMKEHLPVLMKSREVLSISVNQIMTGLSDPSHPGLAEPEGGYAKYLSIFEFNSIDGCKTFQGNSQAIDAFDKAKDDWKPSDVIVKFHEHYTLDKAWEIRSKRNVGLLHFVGVDVPDELKDAMKFFHEKNTVPTLSRNRNLISIERYDIVDLPTTQSYSFALQKAGTRPKILNIYRLGGISQFKSYENSKEMHLNSQNFTRFASSYLPNTFKVVMRIQYLPLKTFRR